MTPSGQSRILPPTLTKLRRKHKSFRRALFIYLDEAKYDVFSFREAVIL